ncbi:MAG: MBL fold metallo-hydrolase [Microbacteriaceae bacterium]|nr:MAG: MBL fold metallo-hydrolase [Microbacteriaceae bacterium]
MEIAPGIHRIECPIGGRYMAVHAIVGTRYMAVIDSGYEESVFETVMPYFTAHDLDPLGVRFVILTHSDYDHSGGASAMRSCFPNALTCAGERDRPMIENLQRMIDDRYGEFAEDHHFDESADAKAFIRSVAKETPVDLGLVGGERIDLGDRYIEVLHTPGHSWGHVAVRDEPSNLIVIGDAVLGDTVPLDDGTPAFPPTYRFVEAYRATIRMLKGRQPAGLLPAHYPPYFGQDGVDFLDLSLGFTDLVESVTLDTLSESPSVLSLREIIERSHARLGSWEAPAYDYLSYAVLGHLEVLEQYRKVTRTRRADGLVAWALNLS